MLVYKSEIIMKVGEAPVGLFLLLETDELICISEYRSGEGKKSSRDAYIVNSGENYCGGDDLVGNPVVIQ